MAFHERILGLISAIAYALQRSKLGFLRLHAVAMLLSLVGAVYVCYRVWQGGLAPIWAMLFILCLLCFVLLLWTDWRRYLVFREKPIAILETVPDLHPEEKLFLRGSGHFEVSKMRRYLVEVPVVFWSTALAEHIIAGKVRALNLLGVGVPSAERGWWYVFLEPSKVVAIETGELCFGWHLRPAVRVQYRTAKGNDSLYLSCNDVAQLSLLCKELQSKAQAARSAKNNKPGF